MRDIRTNPWLIALLAATLHGCASDPSTEDGAAGGSGGGPVGADGAVSVMPAGQGGGLASQDYGGGAFGNPNDPNSPLYERIIYFEYDSSQVAPEYQSVVANHAQYLATNPNAIVSLEGHTDERGTREYNLALGERRAQAVADVMMLQGVAANQTQTLTYGEERPAAIGGGDANWRSNRRVEIVYLSQ